MGYRVKVQKVERPTNTSFYINLPAALAESMQVAKGEIMEWFVENRDTFVLRRTKPSKSLLKNK
jgi:hypothetical protein